MFENLLFEKKEGIAFITVNRPSVRNALNDETMHELRTVFEQVKTDDEVRVAILTGAGDKAFIAGADINVEGSAVGPDPVDGSAPKPEPSHVGQTRPIPARELVVLTPHSERCTARSPASRVRSPRQHHQRHRRRTTSVALPASFGTHVDLAARRSTSL